MRPEYLVLPPLLPGRINDTCYENFWSDATEGTHSVNLYNSYIRPEYLVPPPLLLCYSLDYLGWQLLNQPFLFSFFSLSAQVPVSRMASTTFLRFLELFRLSLALPDPIVVPVPVIFFPVPTSATVLASVPVPVPVPIWCSSTVLYLRPRSGSRPIPAPVPVPVLRSFVHLHHRSRSHFVTVPMTFYVPITVSVPAPDSGPTPDPVSSFLSLGPGYSPRYDVLVQTPGLADGVIGRSQAPPPVCRDGDACGMKVPAVKQKRIAVEYVLLLSLPPDVGTHRSVSPTSAVPFWRRATWWGHARLSQPHHMST